MNIAHLKSWSDYRDCVDRLLAKARSNKLGSPLLFRGHADSEWNLETTLERTVGSDYPVASFYERAARAYRYLGNFSRSGSKFDENVKIEREMFFRGMPNYEYLAYLRHHGLPSPFIDWSQSPYVAAFFAFIEGHRPRPNRPDSTDVAIYVYQEYEAGSKMYGGPYGEVRTLGPWAQIHERHARQQSWYSVCFRQDVGPDSKLVFSSHERVFEEAQPDVGDLQDTLLKILIPKSERISALRDLFLMNVTPYSIYGSEDSLVKTVGMKIFDEIE